MKRFYLAGPMTGYVDLNFPLFHTEAARLRGLGFDIVNPAEINGQAAVDAGLTWAACMRADITQLVTCDGVMALEGWQRSRGASLEVHIAKTLGMPVLMAEDVTRPLVAEAAAA